MIKPEDRVAVLERDLDRIRRAVGPVNASQRELWKAASAAIDAWHRGDDADLASAMRDLQVAHMEAME